MGPQTPAGAFGAPTPSSRGVFSLAEAPAWAWFHRGGTVDLAGGMFL